MATNPITGAQLAVEALLERGVDTIFTLSGGHITPIYRHLENTAIKMFDTRHEQAAVFMAEAYGRLRRKPGVAMVTAGPGFTNTLSAVANARMANAPLVLISGCVGLNCCEKLDLQDIPQAPVIAPMVKKALVCQTPDRVGEFIDMAFRIAAGGRPGPVYLELPVDMLNGPTDPWKVKRGFTDVASRPVDVAQAAAFVDLLAAAKKPMLVAGSGAWYADAGAALTAFAETAGVPIFTAGGGRGVLPDDHPYCFESAIGVRPGATLHAQSDTDLLVLLGTRISLYYMFGDIFNGGAKIVQVDVEAEEIGRNHAVDLPVVGDAKAFVDACNREIAARGIGDALKQAFAPWVEVLKKSDASAKSTVQPTWDSANVPIHPMRLAREIDAFMNQPGDTVIADGGDTQIWMNMTRRVSAPGTYLDSGLYGCLGVGLPFANAAKYLNPERRVCLITGDGSIGFNFMEFETAIRHGLPVVTVISNDLGWGMIRHSQELRLGHAIETGTFIGQVRYEKLVEALGGASFYVEQPADIRPALEAAFASGKTACINVMTDPTTISPGSIALANVGAYK